MLLLPFTSPILNHRKQRSMAVQKHFDDTTPPPPYSLSSTDRFIPFNMPADTHINLNTSATTVTTTPEALETQLIQDLTHPGRLWWIRACSNIAFEFPYLSLSLFIVPFIRIAQFHYQISHEQCPGRTLEFCLLLSVIPLCVSTLWQDPGYRWFILATCFAFSMLLETYQLTEGSVFALGS